ncbi:Arc35p SCDLUD_003751 [Saccharomycodes ludwigii]|uniref:Arc35p n=1 Tax=Saccharomycodes ludwigii TaxID=36035 RepID=UPI001E85F843|nr:hypothetical protein SCDLUD_003751 [Saccharomycodes ludwigii]KAH3900746.1 hypothetical protein SCDLUD_003751 [Saccharomycodes ludwigii]
MLHLPPHNLLLQKTLCEAVNALKIDNKPITLDRIVSDFDYTTFHVSTPAPESPNLLTLSIRTKCYQSISKLGDLNAYLTSKYTSVEGVSPQTAEPGYDYSLSIDLQSGFNDNSIVELSLLKIYVMSFPFQLSINEFLKLNQQGEDATSNTVYKIDYRDSESFFIKPSNDRITVIFETVFQDETDQIFGKVFMQEFVDSRKRNRNIQSSPQVLFSNEAPLEIQSVYQPKQANVGNSTKFITFVLFPRHLSTPEIQMKSISSLCLFRNYFHYHIKCSKAYMHSRMRFRVGSFVKVLNRAKVEKEEDDQAGSGGSVNTSKDENRRGVSGRRMVVY